MIEGNCAPGFPYYKDLCNAKQNAHKNLDFKNVAQKNVVDRYL